MSTEQKPKRPKVIHKLHLDGSENQYESAWIECDPQERYADPLSEYSWYQVTCKRCLKAKPC